MLQRLIIVELLKSHFDFYHSSWILINKKIKNKYQIINTAMNINEVAIRNINLLFNIQEFLVGLVKIFIAFLIDLLFEYK